MRLRTGGADRPAYWLIGFMVRPEHRNGPIGFLLLKEAVRELEVTMSLTVQQTTVRLLTAVGFSKVGMLPNYVRPLRPDRILARIDPEVLGLTDTPAALRAAVHVTRHPWVAAVAGFAARSGLAAWATVNGRPGGALQGHGPVEVTEARLNALWSDCRDTLGCAGGRDAAYLKWRYDLSSTGPYRAATVTDGAVLRGVAVVRAPRSEGDVRLRGIRAAILSDLVYDPANSNVGLALLAQAEQMARSLDADALLASASHRAHGPLFRRRGLNLLVRDATGQLPGPTTLSDWWVLRGDMRADVAF